MAFSKVANIAKINKEHTLTLSDAFVDPYRSLPSPFGFGALSDIVFMRTYSRIMENNQNESWVDCIRRVCDNITKILYKWVQNNKCGYNYVKGIGTSQEMFDRMFHMKFTPPGRGLSSLTGPILDRGLNVSGFNCCFISTQNLRERGSYVFRFTLDLSSLGVGIGFDCRGSDDHVKLIKPLIVKGDESKLLVTDELKDFFKHKLNTFGICDENKIDENGYLTHPLNWDDYWHAFTNPSTSLFEENSYVADHCDIKPMILDQQTLDHITDLIRKFISKEQSQLNDVEKAYDAVIDILQDYQTKIISGINITIDDSTIRTILHQLNAKSVKILDKHVSKLNNESIDKVIQSIKNDKAFDYQISEKKYNIGLLETELKYNESLLNHWIYLCVIHDTRESWGQSLGNLIESYIRPVSYPILFDYSIIRPEGTPLKTFGGVASGALPLVQGFSLLRTKFTENAEFTARLIVDTMNIIGKIIISANLRRSAQIAFHEPTEEFMDLKDPSKNPDRVWYSWASNNSIYAKIGQDYSEVAKRIAINGEPGLLWLENARAYSRMNGVPDHKDSGVLGTNPCILHSTKVLTLDGIFQIKDLKDKSFKVPTLDGTWANATCFYSGKQQLYKITLQGNITYYATKSHEWPVKFCNQDEIIKVDTNELQPGYLIPRKRLTYIHTSNSKSIRLYGENAGNNMTDSVPQEVWTENIDYQSGFIDAVIKKYVTGISGYRVTLKFNNEQMRDDIADLLGFHDVEITILENNQLQIQMYNDVNGKMSICNPKWKDIDYMKVISVEETELVEDVYDITVDDESHTFRLAHCITGNCGEISLEGDGETCNLVEIYPTRHKDKADFLRTIKFAYLYCKTIALGNCHWPNANRVLRRNLRIGVSLSGIVDFIDNFGTKERNGMDILREWMEDGYKSIVGYESINPQGQKIHIDGWDDIYSKWLGVPHSIKVTTVKPSGTVSLLAGVSPGCHWPIHKTYIRRVRLDKNSNLLPPLYEAGYKIEPCFGSEATTVVVEIPIKVAAKRTASEVSIWEKMELAAFCQRYWSDNQVSVTISFDAEKEGNQIENVLRAYDTKLKSVSFLPTFNNSTPYPQMPYEAITEEQYNEITSKLKPLSFNISGEKSQPEMYCTKEGCFNI